MPDAEEHPAAGRGRPRAASVDERLRRSVLELLREGGPSAVTIDRVTAHSGVAKTTIYRRHPDRRHLLRSVLEAAMTAPEVPREGAVEDRIRFALQQVWRRMDGVLGPGGLAALVADTDPEFTALFRDALRPHVDLLVARMEEDRDAGLLRPDLDAEGVVTLTIGAYLGELVRHGEVGDAWLDGTIGLLWRLMSPA